MNPIQLQQNVPKQTSPEEREYLRDLTAARLRDVADYIDGLNAKGWTESDFQVDDLLREWGKLDPRPSYRNPHEGLWPPYVPTAKPKIDILNYPAGSVQLEYARLRPNLKIRAERYNDCLQVATKIKANRPRYQSVEKATGVPWFVIGALHEREASSNFSCYLGNGEPLDRVTRLVPKGRGPFATWESGAIDALRYDGLDEHKDWSFAGCCTVAERYNGLGYRRRGLPSPYVLSFTSGYSKGKFTSDHGFDPDFVDKQIGCAAIWLALGVI